MTSFMLGQMILPLPPLYMALALGYWLLSIQPEALRTRLAPLAVATLLAVAGVRHYPWAVDDITAAIMGAGISVLIAGAALHKGLYPLTHLPHLLASVALWISLEYLAPFATPLTSTITSLQLHNFTGKPELLELTGTGPHLLLLWQSDCRACLPVLAALEDLADRYPQVQVVSINQGDPLLAALRVLNATTRQPAAQLALWDKQQRSSVQLGSGALPLAVLVGPDGQIKHSRAGPMSPRLLERWLVHAEHLFKGDVLVRSR